MIKYTDILTMRMMIHPRETGIGLKEDLKIKKQQALNGAPAVFGNMIYKASPESFILETIPTAIPHIKIIDKRAYTLDLMRRYRYNATTDFYETYTSFEYVCYVRIISSTKECIIEIEDANDVDYTEMYDRLHINIVGINELSRCGLQEYNLISIPFMFSFDEREWMKFPLIVNVYNIIVVKQLR